MKLANQNIFISGASQGIGRAIAERCWSEGANLFLIARDPQKLEATRAALSAKPRVGNQTIACATADVAEPKQAEGAFAKAIDTFGGIDGLVNNAGIYGPMGGVDEVDWNEWVDTIRINLLGTVYLCRLAVPALRKRGRGKIVN